MPELYLPQKQTFDYDDVMLIPQKCIVKSRSEINVAGTLGGRQFALPVVPANMSTIVDETTCEWLATRNIFYVMHRFDVDSVAFTKTMQDKGLYASISLGIKKPDYETVDKFVKENLTPEYITVDVAHGDSDEVINIIKYIKKNLPEAFVIAGNIATVEGGIRLAEAGADALKIGIGPGCFTGDMLVKTSNGLKQIKDIELGEEVLTHTGEYKNVTNRFVFETHQEILEINGITCTPDHEFYVCNKEDIDKINEDNYKDFCFWVKAKDLNSEIHLSLTIED